jgi:hypothetical protein
MHPAPNAREVRLIEPAVKQSTSINAQLRQPLTATSSSFTQ